MQNQFLCLDNTLFYVMDTFFYKIGVFALIKVLFPICLTVFMKYFHVNSYTLYILHQYIRQLRSLLNNNQFNNQRKLLKITVFFYDLASLYFVCFFISEIYTRKLLLPNLVIGGLELLLLLWMFSLWEWINLVI